MYSNDGYHETDKVKKLNKDTIIRTRQGLGSSIDHYILMSTYFGFFI
jgi:hypothetical protein